jgi:ABC-2 type transport system ATP-binding protein
MTVELKDLTIRYGSLVAVDRATAAFGGTGGECGAVGLLGRNGAGKSSVLKAILGLVRASSGSIRILDLPPDTSPLELRRRVGYMPERDAWVVGLNGYETVKLAGQLTGLPERDAARRAHEVLYLVGLDEQRYRPVAGYSTGMRQKVKLATALVHDPELLFLDEPTNGLDPRGRKEMLALIRRLAGELGKSVVLSSHILQDVESVCESVVLMEKGKVLESGPLRELLRDHSRVLLLVARGDQAAIREALLHGGALAIEPREDGALRVVVPESFAAGVVFDAVLRSGGAVLSLVEHRRTLEEVFLGAVEAAAI